MYTKNSLNDLYGRLAQSIDISDELYENAVNEYNALGKWIDTQTPDYKISIFPQGSFSLGTVVKPITDSDDYDLDLVCEFAERHGLSARQLKFDVVKPLLLNYRKISGKIEEKRRCWHVEYDEVPNFHMDIVPAFTVDTHIMITDHNEETNSYEYIGSNPAGYTEWFLSRSEKQRTMLFEEYKRNNRSLVFAQADIEKIKRHKIKTPLQRAVQLLKRHRDIMFERRNPHDKPISVIITTIAGQLYQEENNLVDALICILDEAETYIFKNKHGDDFFIENPSFAGENFADKWNEYPSRAAAFFEWLNQAKRDFTDKGLLSMSRVQMAAAMNSAIGAITSKRVFSEMAKEEELAIINKQIKVDPKAGTLSTSGTVSIPPNHHYGK